MFAAKEMGLLGRRTHVDAAKLWMIRVTHDVGPELSFELRWPRHLEVVDVDDEVTATFGVPVA